MNELHIGNVQLENPFLLAPLAGISDAPMRRLCRQMGASLTYSEMVSAKGLYYNDKKTPRLLFMYEEEGPTAFQIFGHEPEIMAYAARKLDDYRNAILDINMGCPVPKVVKNGEGSALLKDPGLVEEIVAATVSASSKPVTVKIRIGFAEGTECAPEIAKAIQRGGAAAVAVHGRTREQYYTGKADWTAIGRVKEAVDIPVIGNGDVVDVESAKEIMRVSSCDLVMIGRGMQGNPWIFSDLNRAWQVAGCDRETFLSMPTEPTPERSIEERQALMLRQLEDLIEYKGEYIAVREMRKICSWYIHGAPGSAEFRRRVNQMTDVAVLRKEIEDLTAKR